MDDPKITCVAGRQIELADIFLERDFAFVLMAWC